MVYIHEKRHRESLDLSPFQCSEKEIVFKPVSHPARTFETPIQQISASRDVSTGTCIFPLLMHPLILFGSRSLPRRSHLQLYIFAPIHLQHEPYVD